jgi:hypothetical protein
MWKWGKTRMRLHIRLTKRRPVPEIAGAATAGEPE